MPSPRNSTPAFMPPSPNPRRTFVEIRADHQANRHPDDFEIILLIRQPHRENTLQNLFANPGNPLLHHNIIAHNGSVTSLTITKQIRIAIRSPEDHQKVIAGLPHGEARSKSRVQNLCKTTKISRFFACAKSV